MIHKHLIIDGYNVLGAMGLPPQKVVGQGEVHRDQFVASLGLYAQAVHCPVTVVFDAWQRPGNLRHTSHQTGVTVIYTAEGERADQVIQQLIRRYGNETAVVSSDLEVSNVARAFGAFVIRSQEFLTRLKKGSQQGISVRSARGKSVGKDDSEEFLTRPKDKKGNPRKLPKKLRQRNRIMKRF
ncbi:MAG: NYN domain-containing protein [Nitrospirales bacterium]